MDSVAVVILAFFGAIIAFFLFGGYGQGREEKVCNRKTNIIIKINKTCYHIHHWLIFLAVNVFLVGFLNKYVSETYFPIFAFAVGFCIGATIQGLTYRDALQFTCLQC